MFDKEKVQKFINDFVEEALERHEITNPRQIDGRKFSTIEHELWKSLVYRGLVPRGTNNPQSSKALSVYNEVERMFRDSWNSLPTQEMHGESFKKSSKKLVGLHESSKRSMKKKRLNEGCACEGEERTPKGAKEPKHEEFISGDKVSRYILQMTDEELDRVDGFREILAGILDTETKNIKSFRREGLGYRVKVVGGMKDLEKIMDKNVDVLKRLKGAEDEEWSDDEEGDWMTPEEMGVAQKIDWSDDMGEDISDEEKMAYFQSKGDMYDVDMENGLVRLKPEEDWFPSDDQDEDMDDDMDDDMEDWEREGYNSEIAYQNRWRDYED